MDSQRSFAANQGLSFYLLANKRITTVLPIPRFTSVSYEIKKILMDFHFNGKENPDKNGHKN